MTRSEFEWYLLGIMSGLVLVLVGLGVFVGHICRATGYGC